MGEKSATTAQVHINYKDYIIIAENYEVEAQIKWTMELLLY
jgi:hypothetical protein